MERLQRSGNTSSGGGSSGKRRRRSASSSSPETSSGHRSPGRSHSGSAEEDQARSRHDEAGSSAERSRTVLPPPRRREGSANSRPEKSPRPVSGQVRPRRWIYLIVVLVLLALGIWLGIHLLNRWRLEGEGFRVNAGRRLSELAERRVSTARFRQTGSYQLGTATFSVQPVHSDLLASAAFTNVSAEFTPGSWLADEWTVPTLRFQQGDLVFQPEKKLDEQSMWTMLPEPVNRTVAASGGFRFGMTSDPASIALEQGRFDQLNLSWPGPGNKLESLSGMLGNFRLIDGALQLELSGGLLDTAAWPPFAVRQINARLRGTTLEIVSARVGLTADHEVRLTGSAQLAPDGQLNLTADISPLLLKHLLPDLWANTVLGSFEAKEAVWKSQFKTGPAASFGGPFRVTGLVLRGLPFVDKIANLLRKPELALVEFPLLTGEFQWTPAGTRLTGLSATTADGLLRLTGNAGALPSRGFEAELRIDASEAYFAGLPGEGSALFSSGPDGWRSLTFTLGGTDGNITDNIGTAAPVILQSRPPPPSLEMPRMSLPPGVAHPAAPKTPATPPSVAPVPVRPAPPNRPPSDGELERQFKDLLGR